ncbi:hypothetical protein [uncultured Tenacibaculum sp.]|uniref:hypothetical protein n=1 Tax=uncultured Tenacibaculum sp. TaxID=174713 RepID=UPI002603114F|nr:hypothetical protein [uncultured Tenacibaculum sp.]
MEKRSIQSEIIEIITNGLDDLVIENSINDELEIILLDENPNTHAILFTEKKEVLEVGFKLNFKSIHKEVFRKYITKRIERARAVIKVPKNKKLIVHGKAIGITSKSYKGDLSIFIEKGNIKLNKVLGNTQVTLFLGNVYAQLNKNTSLNIETTKGEIVLNTRRIDNQYYKKKEISSFNFKVKSINANVILITE